ncbi:MAG: protease inhibitor I42 family protein [Thermoplasmata archaeon]|nr:protease inhibitor I42 family protein [Thermoplasmata archaeon]
MRAGESFLLELDSNPTTGFRWEAEFDPSLLRLLSSEFAPGGARPGGGGTQQFRFEAVDPGRGRLRFCYRSSWRPTVAREHEVSVTVRTPP